MKKRQLPEIVFDYAQLFKSFEELLEYRKKLSMANDKVATELCEFYATWSAHELCECVGSLDNIEMVPSGEKYVNTSSSRKVLPSYASVQKAAQDLLLAVAATDQTVISGALVELGVPSFCPMPGQVFSRMEDVVSPVSGRAQQVFWVDLALFSAAVEDYQRAYKYVQQARVFDPSSRELYNICVIDGLIALAAGKADEAIQCMDSSTEACQADVDASIQCSLLPPNLDIVEKLFELGERVAVLRYLTGCHNVWQSRRPQIEEFIRLIESGERPDFHISEISGDADQVSHRLKIQWLRACSLEINRGPAKPPVPMSPAQVLKERERRVAECRDGFNAYIKEKLRYLENDPASDQGARVK